MILTVKKTEIIEDERLEILQKLENNNNLFIAKKYYIKFYHILTPHHDLCDKLANKVKLSRTQRAFNSEISYYLIVNEKIGNIKLLRTWRNPFYYILT